MCTCVPPWASRSSSVNGYLFTHPPTHSADTVFKGMHGIRLRVSEATEACRFQFFSEGLCRCWTTEHRERYGCWEKSRNMCGCPGARGMES